MTIIKNVSLKGFCTSFSIAKAEAKQRGILAAKLAVDAIGIAERKALAEKLAAMEAKREAVVRARMQPKLPEEEKALASRYGSMDAQERAYNILLDLGLIQLHVDPESDAYDHSNDDELAPENVF